MKKQLFNLNKIVIYTDGGARGNPGPSSLGKLGTPTNPAVRGLRHGETHVSPTPFLGPGFFNNYE